MRSYLFVAFAATYLAFACFALAQRQPLAGGDGCRRLFAFGQAVAEDLRRRRSRRRRSPIVLWREGADYGALLWVTQLPAGASCVVATLSVRPRLLKPLAAMPARA